MTNIKKQVNETITEQKAKYEAEKDQERKRRFAILSGNLKPIKTSFHLNEGEHAYFEFQTKRFADNEYLQTNTTGNTKRKGTVKRALVGDLLFGKVGAVIGGVTGGSETNYQTSQQRITKTEVIDTGTMILTNKRILFVGKEIVSIPYKDIIATEFTSSLMNSCMIIKYPNMLKNEQYSTGLAAEVELHYKGIMRFIKRDTSNVTEADVDMTDYPDEFIKEKVNKVNKMNPIVRNILIGFGILLFMIIFLKSIIVPFNYFLLAFIVFMSLTHLGVLGKKTKVAVVQRQKLATKKIFIWSIIILLFGLEIATPSNDSTQQNNTTTVANPVTITIVPTKTNAQKKEAAQVAAYKAEIKPIIQQFEAEDAIIEADKSKQDYRTDPVYIHAEKVYSNINQELLNAKVNPPNSYGGYSTFLAWITGDMSDAMDNIVGIDGSSHVNGFSMLEVGTCEADIKIAAKMSPTYNGKDADTTYNGYGGKITDLENIATGRL